MVHSSSGRQGLNTAPNDARRHIKGLKRRRERMPKKITREQWERRVRIAGAGRYEFVRWAVDDKFGSNHKCVVMCVKDGYAWESKVNHLVDHGNGCPQCAGKRIWTAEERIEQINEIKNINFVSWVDGYKGKTSKANVRCVKDSFNWCANVDNLVNKWHGCPQCAGNRRWTADERILQINSLENISFISWVDGYKNVYSTANIRCSVDNYVWNATVNNLINHGQGCPRCAKYGFQLDKKGYLYALRSECGKYVKVGISNEPKRRHKELERSTPFKFNLVEQISGDGSKIAAMERHFHSKYEIAGFVRFQGATEWLVCTPELLEELRELEDVK